ncbi:MAG: hypothetical protein ACXVYY_01340 [Oryzihumus sp.]
MSTNSSGLRDEVLALIERGRAESSGLFLVGYGTAVVTDERGRVKQSLHFTNLITDAGDLYYATKMIVGISPANASAPTAVTGMKLGTGTTAAAKSGAGAALVTYLSGSNKVFDASFPATVNLGGGLGVNAQYKVTYGGGVATSTSLNEVVIVNDAATDATSSAANTIARSVFSSTINKASTDSLAITWNHKALGA